MQWMDRLRWSACGCAGAAGPRQHALSQEQHSPLGLHATELVILMHLYSVQYVALVLGIRMLPSQQFTQLQHGSLRLQRQWARWQRRAHARLACMVVWRPV